MVQRYRNKLSGPLLDRIDLHLTVAREATALNPAAKPGENSASAAALVAEARSASRNVRAVPMRFSICRGSSVTASYPQPMKNGWKRPASD